MKKTLVLYCLAVLALVGAYCLYARGKEEIVFEGKRYMLDREVNALVTAYCTCAICCENSADGVTSTGKNANVANGVAIDPKTIPYGYVVAIDGVGFRICDDTGGAMRQDAKRGITHIDVRMASHQVALQWGKKNLRVRVYSPAQDQSKPAFTQPPPTHIVRNGENLTKIARQYSLTITEIVRLNDLKDPDKIYPGQKLKLQR